MNRKKKKILSYIIVILVLVNGKIIFSYFKKPKDSTKKVDESTIMEAEKADINIKNNYIIDEEAIKIASKAMKDFFNSETDSSTETFVRRQDWSKNTKVEVEGEKYLVNKKYANSIQEKLYSGNIKGAKEELKWALEDKPNIVTVVFSNTSLDRRKFTAVSIDMNADTKEILNAYVDKNLEEYEGQPNENHIYKSVVKFFDNIGIEINEKSILEGYDIDTTFGRVLTDVKLSSGKTASIVLELKSYKVISYTTIAN